MTPNPNNETLIDLNEDVAEADSDLPQVTTRRDIASHAAFDRDGLIRFVIGPDGFVVPDLAEKLPGRGLWVKSDRESLELAIKKNLFSRAAKKQAKSPEGLVDQVHNLLRRRILEQLGLARREGQLTTGFEKVAAMLKSPVPPKAAWLIEAVDGASDGRQKLLSVIFPHRPDVNICGIFNNDELSLALGLENVIHATLIEGRRSLRVGRELRRISGFEPLFPPQWREKPFH
ncbi:MAG: RNA-binding protein [Asticcacaulis sp.]